jgi:hypothetical protein
VGDQGTLEIGPEGTATNKPKASVIVLLSRFSTSIPYADIVLDTYEFEQDDVNGVAYSSY